MKLPLINEENARALEEGLRETEERAERVAGRFLTPRVILPAFLALVLLLGLISAVTVIKEKKQQTTQASEPSAVVSETTVPIREDLQMQSNFLLAFADSATRRLRMLCVLHADSETQLLETTYVSPRTNINVNNRMTTIQEHFTTGGASELLWAVGELMQCAIDRYVIVDDDDFISLAKTMDPKPLMIGENVDYNYNGIAFIIEKGKQTLTADSLCKYFCYACEGLYTGGSGKVTALLSYLASGLLCDPDPAVPKKRLGQVMDYAQTNISAMDLSDFTALTVRFAGESGQITIADRGVFA